MVYSPTDYSFVRFDKGRGDKKVTAVLKNKKTGKEVLVRFGQKGSSTYWDKTGKGNDRTHGDPKVRANYRKRHVGEGDSSRMFSPGWFSWWYLW